MDGGVVGGTFPSSLYCRSAEAEPLGVNGLPPLLSAAEHRSPSMKGQQQSNLLWLEENSASTNSDYSPIH